MIVIITEPTATEADKNGPKFSKDGSCGLSLHTFLSQTMYNTASYPNKPPSRCGLKLDITTKLIPNKH